MGLWRQKLSGRTRGLLLRWSRGEAKPDHMDPFLYLQLTPLPTQLNRPLLSSGGDRELSLHKVDGWAIYSTCTEVANARDLSQHPPTVWTARLGGEPPLWRTLYKPLLKKRTGGLQWRILHGAIATNSFLKQKHFKQVSVLRPGGDHFPHVRRVQQTAPPPFFYPFRCCFSCLSRPVHSPCFYCWDQIRQKDKSKVPDLNFFKVVRQKWRFICPEETEQRLGRRVS